MNLIHIVCIRDARTLNDILYFVTLIDDYSRKVWTFALKFKNQVLDVFQHFHTSVKREMGRQLKYIQKDNSSEYMDSFEQRLWYQA